MFFMSFDFAASLASSKEYFHVGRRLADARARALAGHHQRPYLNSLVILYHLYQLSQQQSKAHLLVYHRFGFSTHR